MIIINYPTNEYNTYSIAEIMTSLQVIYDSATRLGNKCYITTTQPRGDAGYNTSAVKRKLAVIKERDRIYYSKTVIIKNALPVLMIKKMYPVPADKKLHLEIIAEKPQSLTIDIINNNGIPIQRFTRTVTNGTNYLTILVTQLASGMYFVRVSGAGSESLIRTFSK